MHFLKERENVINDKNVLPLVIILSILITFYLEYSLIMLEEIVRTLNQVGFVPCFGLLCRGIGGVQMSIVCAVICYKLEGT